MHIPGTRAVLTLIPALLLALASLPAAAIEQLQLQLGDVSGSGWSATDLALQLDWIDSGAFRVTLQAARAEFPEPLGRLDSVTLDCPVLKYDGAEVSCKQGSLRARSGRLGAQQVAVTLRYRLADGQLQVALQGLRQFDGKLSLHATYADTGWTASLDARQLALSSVLQEARRQGYEAAPVEADGRLDIDARAQGSGADVRTVHVSAHLTSPSFSNAAGTLAGEDLDLQVMAQAQLRGQHWQVELDSALQDGALYVEPVYVEVGTQPLSLQSTFDWSPASREIELNTLDYRHPGVLEVAAAGRLQLAATQLLEQLHATVRSCRLPACYTGYLQPWLHGSAGGQLETDGTLQAELQLQAGLPRAITVGLQQVGVQDTEQRFGFAGLSGHLDWSAAGPARESRLAWDSGQVYRLALGPAALAFASTADSVRLLEPAQLPVLDGMLQLDSLQLERPAGAGLRWVVDGILTPVSMSLLTEALDWPKFGGKLSGVIPSVRYADGELSVGGVLLVRVFDGEVTLRDVRLADPFGPVPRLRLDAQVRNIDLEPLTRTFSFGRIEGRLDGQVEGLDMESWLPVAFEAGFATPPGDRSRHRISQKAVDSISNIGGGGVSGALSRSFLGFLEDFPYDRLGLHCRLANGVCEMSGVEPAQQGYYIVKGRFLPPRLDVIGYSDRVNWDQLVAQVIAVTHSQSAVVK